MAETTWIPVEVRFYSQYPTYGDRETIYIDENGWYEDLTDEAGWNCTHGASKDEDCVECHAEIHAAAVDRLSELKATARDLTIVVMENTPLEDTYYKINDGDDIHAADIENAIWKSVI